MLTTAGDLQQRIATRPPRLIDCRFVLLDPAAGRAAYQAGHLPGAIYADLETDLSGPIRKGHTGRHPLPDSAALDALFSTWGLTPESSVVLYDDNANLMAARLWWMLKWAGIDDVSLLDGGLREWLEHGGTLSRELPATPPVSRFRGRYPADWVIGADELLASLHSPARTLIDARGEARYRGEVEPIDPIAGHIPGAICRPCDQNLDARGRFLPATDLRQRFSPFRDTEVVTYCGSGVTACHNLFAMLLAGLPRPRLYAGSWSEWITDPGRPLATVSDSTDP